MPRQIERNADALLKEFPRLFSGKLGKIKDVKVKLDIDDTVRPVRQSQRPIPFHLRAAVEKELLQHSYKHTKKKAYKHSYNIYCAHIHNITTFIFII